MTASLRRPVIAGNWKMNLGLAEAAALARAVRDGLAPACPAQVLACVPFTALAVVSEVLRGSPIGVGAQDLFWEAQGAFTGEVSGPQLVDAGASAVIVGHSERRHVIGESDETVARKLRAAFKHGLAPILCVGETLEERESQRTWRVLDRQLESALKGIAPAELSRLLVAYEPVWAIGTGRTATPAQAQEAHLHIRRAAARIGGDGFAAGLRLLYGGSVKPENIDGLMSQGDVDGALVGGESLKPVGFLRIAHFQVPAAR